MIPHIPVRVAGVFKAETNIKVRMAPDVNAPSLAGAESAKLKSGGGVLGASSHGSKVGHNPSDFSG